MAKRRFFVVNANDWFNKGDVTNRLGLVLALKKEFGDNAEIILETLTPLQDKPYFERFNNISTIESVFATSTRSNLTSIAIETLKNTLMFLSLFFLGKIVKSLRKPINVETIRKIPKGKLNNMLKAKINVSLLYNSDAIISSPGGFLHDDYPPILLINLMPLMLSILLKKPYVIYNQSIGPLRSKILSWITKVIVCKAKIITLREDYSLGDTKIPCKYIITADSTFSLKSYIQKTLSLEKPQERELGEIIQTLRNMKEKSNLLIGLTLVGYYLTHKDRKKMLTYIRFLGHSLNKINEIMNNKGVKTQFIVIPQNSNSYELKLINTIVHILRDKYNIKNIMFIDKDLKPEDIFKILSYTDLLIASRMHSAIFASILSKPVIMLSYQPKFRGIAKMLGIQEFVFDIFKLDKEKISKFIYKIERIIARKEEIKRKLDKATTLLETRANTTAKIIKLIFKN